MKSYLIALPIAFLAVLAGCNNNKTQNPPQDPEVEQEMTTLAESDALDSPIEQQASEMEDVAQNVLSLIDRKHIPERISGKELEEALAEKRVFDEYTSPLHLSITKGDGGIYNIAYVDCYPMLNEEGTYYVVYYTEAGVDGAVLENIMTYKYRNGMLLDEPCPFTAPKFNEFFEGVEIPSDMKAEYNQMKRDYERDKNPLQGLDLRHGAQDDNIIELRPSYIASDALWELAKPVCYEFNGTTFVKMHR